LFNFKLRTNSFDIISYMKLNLKNVRVIILGSVTFNKIIFFKNDFE
jgi:hypothetical protein